MAASPPVREGRGMIALHDVALTYQTSAGGVQALHGLTLSVPAAGTLAVVGASGSGKSSLLHVMAGLIRPTAGQVTFDGAALTAPRREIAMVFQDYTLLPWKTLAANMELPLRLRGEPRARARAQTEDMMRRLGLFAHRAQYPQRLSGGQRQRGAIGRAMLCGPKVLLLDEPFSALDTVTRARLRADLTALCDAGGLCCVLVTHSVEEALTMGDRIAVFSPGGKTLAGVVENEGRREDGFLASAECLQRMAAIGAMLAAKQGDAS